MLDTEAFLSQTTEEATSTRVIPIEAGEFPGVIEKIDLAEFVYRKGERAGQTGYALNVFWNINAPEMEERIGRPPKVRQFLGLEMNGDALAGGEGVNVQLGRLREAVNQNVAGQPWNPNMLVGQVAILHLKQRMEGDDIYTDVDKVAKMN